MELLLIIYCQELSYQGCCYAVGGPESSVAGLISPAHVATVVGVYHSGFYVIICWVESVLGVFYPYRRRPSPFPVGVCWPCSFE